MDAAKFKCKKYTVCYQSFARYYPDGSSSIKKYLYIYMALIDELQYYSKK